MIDPHLAIERMRMRPRVVAPDVAQTVPDRLADLTAAVLDVERRIRALERELACRVISEWTPDDEGER